MSPRITFSLNSLPALNFGAFFAGISIGSPVFGFLAFLAALSTLSKEEYLELKTIIKTFEILQVEGLQSTYLF